MIANRFNRLLRAPEGVETSSGAGAPAAAPAAPAAAAPVAAPAPPAAPAAAAPAAPAAVTEPRKPGRMEMLSASLKDKGALVAQVNDLTAELGTSRAEITRLTAELATTRADLTRVSAELAEVDQALGGARASAKTAEALAVDIAASQGVPAVTLPAALIAGSIETVASLQEKMATTTDAKERWKIQAKIDELEG